MSRVLVAKGTWSLSNGKLAVAERQFPVLRQPLRSRLDELALEPVQRSVLQTRESDTWTRFESDFVPVKPNFDIIINAWAQTSDGTPRANIRCGVDFEGKPLLDLVAHAPRIWQKGVLGATTRLIGKARRIPVIYPFAFGGPAISTRSKKLHWKSNQQGMGYCAEHSAVDGLPLPWIESPTQPIRHWNETPEPIALGHTSPVDLPRKLLQGTFDAQWRCTRAPLPPADFDLRHYNAAPPPLQLSTRPKAGQRISLRHLGKHPAIDLRLPATQLVASAETRGGTRLPALSARWDTLLIEPEMDHYMLVWRVEIPDSTLSPVSRITLHARMEPHI